MLFKSDYYTEESILSHAIKNVTVQVGEKAYTLNIPAGAYEEDGIYFNLGSYLKSRNYSVNIEVPENKYYNAKTFTFKNAVRIISESNKAICEIDKYNIIPINTFSGIAGDVCFWIKRGVADLNMTGNVTVTLTSSKTTKTYKVNVNRNGKITFSIGRKLAIGDYTIKVKYYGNKYYKSF